MLIFRESGRLGNQIFQYAALRSILEDREKLVLLGFEELQDAFEGIEAKLINSRSSIVEKIFYRKILRFLSAGQLCTHIRESRSSATPVIERLPGLLGTVKIAEESYFQSEDFFYPHIFSSLSINHKLLVHAEKRMDNISSSDNVTFVHARRGDHSIWPSKDAPAILPDSYYMKCIDIISSRYKKPFFVFMSDDHAYLQKLFGDMENSYISQGDSLEDFALMSHCHNGILSASSFSWWAAYLSSAKGEKSSFLAPKYWAGHSHGKWYPKFIKSQNLEYIDV